MQQRLPLHATYREDPAWQALDEARRPLADAAMRRPAHDPQVQRYMTLSAAMEDLERAYPPEDTPVGWDCDGDLDGGYWDDPIWETPDSYVPAQALHPGKEPAPTYGAAALAAVQQQQGSGR